MNFSTSSFFHESLPPGPSTPLRPFRIFIKFVEIFESKGYSGVHDTSGKREEFCETGNFSRMLLNVSWVAVYN